MPALHVYSITAANNKQTINLHGDMSVLFDAIVPNDFKLRLFTTTSEQFRLDSTLFQFCDLTGNLANGLLFGGSPSMFLDLMFDPINGIWYITAHNVNSSHSSGSGSSVDTAEKNLTFLAAPAKTPINYANGKNYRGILETNAVLANPTNMSPGDRLFFVLVQGSGGSKTLGLDGAYGTVNAQPLVLSSTAGKVDILDCYMTGDYTLVCDLRTNYSVINALAYAGDTFYYTMGTAINAAQLLADGQTVQVIRDGSRIECNGTVGFPTTNFNNLTMRIRGVAKSDGSFPALRLTRADRPSFGKAIVNIEGGKYIAVENLTISGASSADGGNGTGVMINAGPGPDYVLMKNLYLFENEDGVRSGVGSHPHFDMVDVFLERNGFAANGELGQAHSIYAGDCEIWRANRVTFYDAQQGHNIKTRALKTVLNRVYSRKSNFAREIDCCDQGLLHATDSVFWKEASAAQNNLIGIGHEMLGGSGRAQEYFFVNCYFHNDVDPTREVTYLENHQLGATLNTAVVHFIDCEWGGAALAKSQSRESLFSGPYTITLTGGPVGPREPVGDSRMLFDPSTRDPNRSSNPLNIPLTPFDQLPPMTVTEPTPPYPTTWAPVSAIPELPKQGAFPPGYVPPVGPPDTINPAVILTASSVNVTTNSDVVLTATASDNVGIAKVDIYRGATLLVSDVVSPYTFTESYTPVNNGTINYTAKAYDAAGNATTSAVLSITVNIIPPHIQPTTKLDVTTQSEYDAAINGAVVGSKRMAGATALVNALAPDNRLYIYQDGYLVVPVEYAGNCTVVDNGQDIVVEPASIIDSSDPTKYGDLAVGVWWFEMQGGADYGRVITGSVGIAGSGADLELDSNPTPGQGFSAHVQFVMPRSLDGLS